MSTPQNDKFWISGKRGAAGWKNGPRAEDGEIMGAVRQCLNDFGYEFAASHTGSVVFQCVVTGKTRWRSQFKVSEKEQLLRFFVYLTDEGYDDDIRDQVMELGARMNELVVVGAIVSELDLGEVVFRSSISFDGRVPTAAEVENMMNLCSFPIQLWDTAYGFVRRRAASPALAIQAARMVLAV